MSAGGNPRTEALKLLAERKPVLFEGGNADKKNVFHVFGSDVFDDRAMSEKMSPAAYKSFRHCLDNSLPLAPHISDEVANAMKSWAMDKGATHFCHWFQPMTGLTAEKHDSFLSFYEGAEEGRKLTMEFSGKVLVKGEPDASSFPHGGTRSTFEARGYTVWDMSSPCFIRDGPNGKTLCVPTAFCSWTGEALDKKTPLLRSEEALNEQASRLCRLMGDPVKRVYSTLGAEQEYFIIDRALYNARPDIRICGRSLVGSAPPKGQQMEDHYFGAINPRILAFMQEVEWRLWALGVPAKTRHNEVAPGQHEMAPIFEKASIACDHNLLTMDIMLEVAERHNLACLLHEKPFAGVNGSGKHNNWSMSTDEGENLLEPGHNPHTNARFLAFLSTIVRAVDEHADLLRTSVATPGNDFRLGANEAPPAIMSVFLGDELDRVCKALMSGSELEADGQPRVVQLGVSSLPPLPRDTTDRNRTSPFAFTGNKFEFRAVGSSQSCARPITIINTIVADSIRKFADALEAALAKGTSVELALQELVQSTLSKHYRVVFGGDGYSAAWREEAARRGLPNLRSTPEALSVFNSQKNISLFESLGVLSRIEVESRYHVQLEQYYKAVAIESRCVVSMAKTLILPAAIQHQRMLADSILETKEALGEAVATEILKPQVQSLQKTAEMIAELINSTAALERLELESELIEEGQERAYFCHSKVMTAMLRVRTACDELEKVVDDLIWPMPKYQELLFSR